MTDYVQGFWDAILMIRDNGATANPNIEFWVYAGDQGTNFGYVQFEKRVNNVTTVVVAPMPAYGRWIQVSTDNAIWGQYVTFQLDTNLNIIENGSAGPNYPYSYTVYISRPTVPDPPIQPYLNNITVNSMNVWWDDVSDGGAPILGYQLGYGQNPAGPTTIISANPPTVVTNLPTGVVSYFWARARNYQGWSGWSAAASARTYLGAYVKVNGVWKLSIPYVRASGVWKEAEPYTKITGIWKR